MYVVGEDLKLTLPGVGHFDDSVVYAKIDCKPLYGLERRLVKALKEKQIDMSSEQKFCCHDYIEAAKSIKR